VVKIRRGGSAGDVNALVRLHREVYEREYGLDASFADGVATQMAELRRRGFPGAREGLWVAEAGGEPLGTITLIEESLELGRLGHLVLRPDGRGSGAGRRLVDTVLEAARAARYGRIHLYTFADLRAAGSLYRGAGFEVAESEDTVRWGRRMQWQRYERAV
jgi:GNAT superfamily N-acetyltransferase